MLRSCLAISKGKKAAICKIFLLLPVSALNIFVHRKVVPKTIVEKFSFSELKIQKVILFTQSLTKFCDINIFSVWGCLASCLMFRPFLMLDPYSVAD